MTVYLAIVECWSSSRQSSNMFGSSVQRNVVMVVVVVVVVGVVAVMVYACVDG